VSKAFEEIAKDLMRINREFMRIWFKITSEVRAPSDLFQVPVGSNIFTIFIDFFDRNWALLT